MTSYPTAKLILDKALSAALLVVLSPAFRVPLRRDGRRHALVRDATAARGSTASGGSHAAASSTS